MEFKQKEGQKALISLCDSLKAWIDFAIYQKSFLEKREQLEP